MAEGGSDRHRDPQTVSTDGDSLDSHLLECPICLEQLRQPKSLPCLHCFCEECLSTFIMKDLSGQATQSSFSCPVCRRTAYPVDSSEKNENWAKHLPTNTLIQELIQLQKKSHSPLYCKPCDKKRNIETPAKVWCKSCKLLFCEACKVSHHDVLHDDCDIVVIAGTDETGTEQASTVVRCSKHKEKIDYFCENHRIIGCSQSIIIDHRRCEIVTAEEYCEKLKTSSHEKNLLRLLHESVDSIEGLMQECIEQLQTLEKQEKTGMKTIAEIRQKVDKMQKEITDELITAIKQGKARVEVNSEKCDQLKTSILNTVESFKSAAKKNDNMEMMLLFQRGQMEVGACKDLVTEIRTSQTPVSVKHVTQQDTTLNLGKIVVEKQSGQLSGGKEKQPTSLSECRVKKIEKFCIKCPTSTSECQANGVVYLPDNHIVVADSRNQKLKLYTDKGQYLTELEIKGQPNDLCMVNNNTVAVAVKYPGSVQVVSVQFSKMSLLFEIKSPEGKFCYGIIHKDGKFLVSTSQYKTRKYDSGTVLEVYSLTAKGKSELLHTLSNECYSLTSDSKRGYIYASQFTSATGKTALYRLSGWKLTEIMKTGVVRGACGVDVDKEGNLYLCGSESNNVIQISGDGTNVRKLLLSSDGLNHPRAISVCGDKFVVTNNGDQGNYVHVYSLY